MTTGQIADVRSLAAVEGAQAVRQLAGPSKEVCFCAYLMMKQTPAHHTRSDYV